MTVIPLGNRITLKRVPRDTVTKGGIIIPDTAQKRAHEGVVERVGPGRCDESGVRRPIDLKAGDRVLFGPYVQGTAVNGRADDDDTLFLVDADEIDAVIGSAE